MSSTVPDFYGVAAAGITAQVDTITLSHTSPAALSRKGITSFPAFETAGATPSGNVIKVFDVTSSHALVLGTDYTLAPSGAGPSLTYSVTRLSGSTLSSDGDTATVTYAYGTVTDTGGAPGFAGTAPTGTQFQAGTADTEGASASGLGSAGGYGSLTDPAMGSQSSSETGAPGSEYAVTGVPPGARGWPLGSPDTEGVLGGGLPESYAPTDTSYGSSANPGIIDTVYGAGSALAPNVGSQPSYRAPTVGVAAGNQDTTRTDLLGNQASAQPTLGTSQYASTVDTSYSGTLGAPTQLAAQADSVTAAAASTRYYLSQTGLIPSSVVVTDSGQAAAQTDSITASHTAPVALSKTGITSTQAQVVVTDTTTSHTLALGTDYTFTPSGSGATATYSITRVNTSSLSSDGDTWHVTYTWGNAAFFSPVALVSGTDYALTVAGNGATTAAYITLSTGSLFAAADNIAISYSYGDAVYWDSNTPAAVPGAPAISSVTAVNKGAQVTFTPPSGTTPVDYYLVQSSDGGTQYVPATGQPVLSGQPSPSGGADVGQPTYQADTFTSSFSHTVPVTLSKTGIITAPQAIIVRDLTTAGLDPSQPTGTVLQYGYDYTVTQTGTGPWGSCQIQRVASSVNSADGDTIIAEYWYGLDPSSLTTVFTQGLVENTPVIYNPDGSTRSSVQGYRFCVAAGNRAGLGPYSAWSAYVIPLNTNAVPTGSLDPANTVNPVYTALGTIKSGTGLGG